jgi:hypothetical protein
VASEVEYYPHPFGTGYFVNDSLRHSQVDFRGNGRIRRLSDHYGARLRTSSLGGLPSVSSLAGADGRSRVNSLLHLVARFFVLKQDRSARHVAAQWLAAPTRIWSRLRR